MTTVVRVVVERVSILSIIIMIIIFIKIIVLILIIAIIIIVMKIFISIIFIKMRMIIIIRNNVMTKCGRRISVRPCIWPAPFAFFASVPMFLLNILHSTQCCYRPIFVCLSLLLPNILPLRRVMAKLLTLMMCRYHFNFLLLSLAIRCSSDSVSCLMVSLNASFMIPRMRHLILGHRFFAAIQIFRFKIHRNVK